MRTFWLLPDSSKACLRTEISPRLRQPGSYFRYFFGFQTSSFQCLIIWVYKLMATILYCSRAALKGSWDHRASTRRFGRFFEGDIRAHRNNWPNCPSRASITVKWTSLWSNSDPRHFHCLWSRSLSAFENGFNFYCMSQNRFFNASDIFFFPGSVSPSRRAASSLQGQHCHVYNHFKDC